MVIYGFKSVQWICSHMLFLYVWISHRNLPVARGSTLWDLTALVISSLLHSTHTPVVLFAAAEPHRDAFVVSIHVKRNGNLLNLCSYKLFYSLWTCKWLFLSLIYGYGNTVSSSICLCVLSLGGKEGEEWMIERRVGCRPDKLCWLSENSGFSTEVWL